MANAQSIILHHYPTSPFAEKIRRALAIKNLAWASVTQPVIMPKPDLAALTGGYRRIPVMQIGADIYCDTRLILEELEKRFTLHPLNHGGHEGTGAMVAMWTDRQWFPITAQIVFAEIGDHVPDAFKDDRAKATGRPFDIPAMKKAAPFMREQWVAHLCWINDRLKAARHSGTGDFLLGSKPGLVDVHAVFNIWFAREHLKDFIEEAFAATAHVADWYDRMYEFEGQEPEELTPEQAIQIAKSVAPRLISATVGYEPRGLRPGDRIHVAPDDFAKEGVEGELVHADKHRIVLKRHDERAETINVHFPRAGYVVRKVEG